MVARSGRGGLADHHLTLAIITKATRLQHARSTEFANSFFEIGKTIDSRKRGCWNAQIIQKAFFGKEHEHIVIRLGQSRFGGEHRMGRAEPL